MRGPKCRYDLALGWVTPEHVRDCREHDCAGCKPCPKSHCALRGRCANHVEQGAGIFTCPSCIGKVRSDLAAIADLYATAGDMVSARLSGGMLLDEAEETGIESEAFNLIGPAASTEQVQARRAYADAERGWCEYPRPDDPHHPYAVLGRWDIALRESYGPMTDLFVTVTSAANYLTRLLAGEFPHTREFEEFSREVVTCRVHLEQVVHDSREPESGAPCPTCAAEKGDDEKAKVPKLQRRYAPHPAEDCKRCDVKAPIAERRSHDDTWHCPDNGAHWWTHADYEARVDGDYVTHATKLTMTDLPERTGVNASTLRRWAARKFLRLDGNDPVYDEPRLKSCGWTSDGRKLYRVADVEALKEALGRVA